MNKLCQYSCKLDDIHLYWSDSSETLCGKPMLSNNYLVTGMFWSVEDRRGLLKLYPRIVCEKCLDKLSIIEEV